ncbi:CDP-glycerol glycerophosphotransferase family protein [Bacillus sp. FJAT-49736]|nr:CDP-glycerol glycerophosphotransferase family protein [Bacillus sp. FJAT-49736]
MDLKMKLLNKIKKHGIVPKVYRRLFNAASYLPVKKNLIVFESYSGKQYSCNPRALYEYLKENYPHYQLVWSVKKEYENIFIGRKIPYIRRFSIKWLIMMARAQYWINNARLPLWIDKPRHTTYLQTWHGTPLKKLAEDMDEVYIPGTNTELYKQNFRKATSKWDYLISPNKYSTDIFKRAFNFNKTMIESGYPRNDFLYNCRNQQTIEEIKKRCHIPMDKKVILYAPTWRDDDFYSKGKYKFDIKLDLDKLRTEFGNEYVIILRMHYLVAENFDLSPYEGFAYDLSNHEDIRELYLISDLLITDYSSVFFDYANLKRPILFYTYDIQHYRDKLRGFYFDFEKEAPGPLLTTTEEVMEAIKEVEKAQFQVDESFQEFYNTFCYLENGNSSKKVVEKLFAVTR